MATPSTVAMAKPSRISPSVTQAFDQVAESVTRSTVARKTASGAGSTNFDTSAIET